MGTVRDRGCAGGGHFSLCCCILCWSPVEVTGILILLLRWFTLLKAAEIQEFKNTESKNRKDIPQLKIQYLLTVMSEKLRKCGLAVHLSIFSQESVVKDVSQLHGPKTVRLGIFFCMILLLCWSLSSYLRVTLSLWVMLGIWHPASKHCLSKSTMHPFTHLASYGDNVSQSTSTVLSFRFISLVLYSKQVCTKVFHKGTHTAHVYIWA